MKDIGSLRLQAKKAQLKRETRVKIRNLKDFEDDLTDLKKIVQFMTRGLCAIWDNLPEEQKQANAYRNNFDQFSAAAKQAEFRIDLELDQVTKVAQILSDEADITKIVKENYIDKLNP